MSMTVEFQSIEFWLFDILLPIVGLLLAGMALFYFFRGQPFRFRGGSAESASVNKEISEIRKRIDHDLKSAGPSDREFALLKEYHAQGLAQSKTSFWFSLLFASLGFLIIVYSIVFYLGINPGAANAAANPPASNPISVQKPIFTLVAGTVVEAVAGLFFVQSNKARKLMSEFFDKARMDRKVDESLLLVSQVDDPVISAKLKAFLALSFADVNPSKDVLDVLLTSSEGTVSQEVHHSKPDDA